ncbi:basic form of pathoproteinsis-related protein 1 [Hibiscus syriacus]|uniref:Basic form of pathoproteinsis-related protein 1 n=1 Tax=Hibiscus syriacus TaxID=106335 RepID=A0A6A3A6I0_HIBSY|nr:basic form of pathoproteinsis-related protein 1 [Hibiscus syriacus]
MRNKFPVNVCLIALTVAHVSVAQNSPQDHLRVPNAAPAQVEAEQMTWDITVAAYA